MEVVIQASHADAHTLREWVDTRVRFVTRRMSRTISRVVIRLKDVNGPRGGVDKHCQIQLTTAGGQVLLASSSGRQWQSAVEAALARTAGALRQKVLVDQRPAMRRSALHWQGPSLAHGEALS